MSNVYYGVEPYTGKILKHYGIEGMKKGRRRWQYPDGRFNEEGKERYFGKSKKGNKKLVKTKTETKWSIGIPKILSFSRKVVRENPQKFTDKKQNEFNEAMKIWFDDNFYNYYGIDNKYTDIFNKYFYGDNSKMVKALEKGKYCIKFEKDIQKQLEGKSQDYFTRNKAIKESAAIGALLDLGIKPSDNNIKMMTEYISSL